MASAEPKSIEGVSHFLCADFNHHFEPVSREQKTEGAGSRGRRRIEPSKAEL